MKTKWKGREAVTPELLPAFEDWEPGAWRIRLVETYGAEWVGRLEFLAFDRANELVALDLGRTISTNWPVRLSGFITECVSSLKLGSLQERAVRREFDLVIESLSTDARRLVYSARRSIQG